MSGHSSFETFSLKHKIMIPVTIVVLIVMLSVNWYTLSRVNRLSMGEGIKLGEALGNQYGNDMKRQLEVAMETGQTFAQSLSAMKSHGEPSRELVTGMIKEVMDKNPAYMGMWCVWEPGAFDGDDGKHAGTPGHDATGRFIPYWNRVGGLHLEPCMDYEKGSYYTEPLKTGKDYITEPTIYKIAGRDTMVVSISIPIMINGSAKGVTGIDLSMDWFAQQTAKIKPFETGFAYLIAAPGIYVSHPDKDRAGKGIDRFLTGSDKDSILRAVQSSKTYVHRPEGNEDSFTIFNPIRIEGTDASWSLAVSIPVAKVLSGNRKVSAVAMAVSVLGVLLIVLLVYAVLNHLVIHRVNVVAEGLRNMAEGEGDLTKRLVIKYPDEIGNLALWFNKFVESAEAIISKVRDSAENASTSSKEVSAGAQQLSQSSQEQASAIEEIAATIEELASTIKNNAGNASKGRDKGKDAENRVANGNEIAHSLLKAMEGISESSRKIGEIISRVDNVAFQTNLLALNAAVEAARAGEYGKGFAVVAEEVRSLAQKSSESAREIRSLIQETVEKVAVGDDMVKKTAGAYEEIRETIEVLVGMIEEIAASSNEQASGIDELNRAISQIDSSTQANAGTVEELSASAGALAVESNELNATVGRFKLSQKPSVRKPAAEKMPEKKRTASKTDAPANPRKTVAPANLQKTDAPASPRKTASDSSYDFNGDFEEF